MKSYLSLIPISAKVHRRQNRMTLLCIVFAVFMVTAVFSMAEMGFRMEQARLVGKHGSFSIGLARQFHGANPSFCCGCSVPADFDCRRFDDFQQHEQQRCTENPIFRNDALHWYE